MADHISSRYCQLFREFERRLSPSMRQTHVAGDKAFVDFSGKKMPIIDPITGAVREAEIFVAVLGASNLTYAEATWTQGLPDWIGAHVRMFRFWGARPRLLVPDNLRSGVHKASFYDPEINRSYGAMAAHYGVGILPARPYHPKDKAKVEAGVRIRSVLRAGPAAQHEVLLPRRMQRGDHRDPGAAERAGDAPPRGQPARAVRDRRATGNAAAASNRVRVCRMGVRPGRDRLSRRGGRVLLLGPARADPPTGRDTGDRAHGGSIPPRPTRCRTRAPLRRSAARHLARPHAERASAVRRVEPRTLPEPGPRHRSQYRGADHRRAGPAATPGAGVPHLPRHPASLSRHRCCSGRGCLLSAPSRSARSITRASPPSSSTGSRPDGAAAAADGAPILHANIRGSRYYH